MKRDHQIFVKDIIAAIKAIEQFVEGLSLSEFKDDDRTSSAVIRKFEIIGEAAKHIPESVKGTYPDVPWKRMAGMRDRLIHGYFGIDYQLVWDAIQLELPELKPRLKKILTELQKSNSQP
ncbi:MAG TPA: DUF86 domain-containing protein [Desulfatiglandales bacterium]|nr:DUF86 domain-containing protein [Desulfatiglandales bacterium]